MIRNIKDLYCQCDCHACVIRKEHRHKNCGHSENSLKVRFTPLPSALRDREILKTYGLAQ